MLILLACFSFSVGFVCALRAFVRDESGPMIAAALFFLAGVQCLL